MSGEDQHMGPDPIRRERRRNLSVNPGGGGSLFRRILLAEALVVGAAAAASFLLAYLIFSPSVGATAPGFQNVIYAMGIAAIAAMAAIFVAVRVSQRISGPVAKIRHALDELKSGRDPGIVRIRSDDEFHDLVDTLNEAVAQIRRRNRDERIGSPPVSPDVLTAVTSRLVDEASEAGVKEPSRQRLR